MTLVDRHVRDTQELPRSRVKIDRRQWNKAFLPVLYQLRQDLGLPPESRLRAELHSELVYGRGQFFVPHQDSEKADEMVGSLVVTLPSTHTGGALVVEHGSQVATYRPKTALTFVAFYSDCRHQVRPMSSGYRVSLTFNLLLQGARAATGLDAIALHCAARLDARLARPQRTDGDWSIRLPAGCTCELCGKLRIFLGDATRRSLEWPLRKDRRQHVHSRINNAELPVRHQTRRTGSPYTLILTKTDDLFDREREARDRDDADLHWLQAAGVTVPAGQTILVTRRAAAPGAQVR